MTRNWSSVPRRNWDFRFHVEKREPLTVEKLAVDCLDVRELQRHHLFRDGCLSLSAFRWPKIERMRISKHLIQLNFNNKMTTQQIRVSWTPCNYGGARPWLHCPHCEQRVARLFKGMGGYFCRVCIDNPIYESQRRSTKARAYLQAYRLRQRLGGSRPVVDPLPERPYRMKRRKYRQLCARIEQLERPLIGSRIVRRAPKWFRPLVY